MGFSADLGGTVCAVFLTKIRTSQHFLMFCTSVVRYFIYCIFQGSYKCYFSLSVLLTQFCFLLFVTVCICVDKYINK